MPLSLYLSLSLSHTHRKGINQQCAVLRGPLVHSPFCPSNGTTWLHAKWVKLTHAHTRVLSPCGAQPSLHYTKCCLLLDVVVQCRLTAINLFVHTHECAHNRLNNCGERCYPGSTSNFQNEEESGVQGKEGVHKERTDRKEGVALEKLE